jgi:dipeptidyl aminopeptidase/acylaminoacyl peptidase
MTLWQCLLALAWLGGLESASLAFAQSLETHDMVILGDRVMDPASGLDAPRNIGIQQGRISTITPRPISGRDTIQTRGLVVAPGFIDLHSHGEQGPPAAGLRAPQCSIDAVVADPSPPDSAYPPEMRTVRIPSGVDLNGVLYLAQGAGPHPTTVFLHGFPGDEKNLDLAQAVRRAGFNALVFYYRGAWGSPGDFSRVHALEDVVATLAWLQAPATVDSFRVDPARLILVGHSFGGFAALYTAARSEAVAAVAALAPADLGERGAALRDPAVFAREAKRRTGQIGALRGTSGEALSRELLTHADEWSLLRHANALARKRVLLVAAARDEAVPMTEVYEPLGAKLREAGARELTTLMLPTDHAFSSARVRLAQALTNWLCEAR